LPADGALVAEVPRAALGAVVRPKLEEAWASAKRFLLAEDERSRRAHGGRPPDFADPTAIVAAADGWVTRHLAVLGDLAALRLALAVTDDGLVLTSTLTPQPGDGAAARFTSAMATGDVAELAKLPAVSAVAWLTRDSDAARAAQAVEAERALGAALGGRLSELDAKRLRDVLEDVAKARGDLVASSLVWDEPQGLALRAEVRDAAAADRALRGIAELAKSGPFKELLRVRSVTTTSSEVSGLGKASTVTVAREPSRSLRRGPRADDGAGAMRVPGDGGADDAGASGSPARRDDLGFAWRVEGGVLELAASEAPLATLAAAARPDRKLADEPAVARALAALGSTSSAVLLVQPLRFDRARAGLPAAPVVVALGRKEGAAVLRVDVANGVLRELARRQMGL
jgi:hypothetical protein